MASNDAQEAEVILIISRPYTPPLKNGYPDGRSASYRTLHCLLIIYSTSTTFGWPCLPQMPHCLILLRVSKTALLLHFCQKWIAQLTCIVSIKIMALYKVFGALSTNYLAFTLQYQLLNYIIKVHIYFRLPKYNNQMGDFTPEK